VTCNDCVHVEVCETFSILSESFEIASPERIASDCEHFKDHSRFVELPCRVGDKVYFNNVHLRYARVIAIYIDASGGMFDLDITTNIATATGYEHFINKDYTFEDIGRRLFLTREEAEQALSKRTQKKENEFYRGHCVSDDGKFCKHIKAAKGDNLSNDNTMSCEYGEVNCPYAKPLEEVSTK